MPKDRYRYFRVEARELLDEISRGLLELERSPEDRALVSRLLRHAHTLKGAARVVQQTEIGELAHAAEDALSPHRDAGSPAVPRERVDALLGMVDRIAARVAALEPAPPQGRAAPAAAGAVETVRVDLRDVDSVLEAAFEAGAQVSGVRHTVGELDDAREIVRALTDQLAARRGDGDVAASAPRLRALVDELARRIDGTRRALEAGADRAEREIAEVRTAADRVRLLPVRGIFGALERAVRDAARALDREVTFETAGGEVRVDANVLSRVAEALLHAVRNAAAHGIEPPAERVRAGKPAAGRVGIEVQRRGERVVFLCRDDGRGIDRAAVREAAIRRGLLSEADAAALDAEALSTVLLRGGISTSAEVTPVAGRGVGLDVVRDVAAQLRAEVTLRSAPGRGATLEMSVPASLTAVAALHVAAGNEVVAIPLEAVRRAAWVEARSVARSSSGPCIADEGALVPFLALDALLRVAGGDGAPTGRAPRRAWSAVVLESGGARVAIGADRLVGTGEIVVRRLPAFVMAEPTIAGAALDPEGNPRLVLDPDGILAAARQRSGADEEHPAGARAPILVIDDSLTTRMLEQSILESAGYEVDLAVSAEEALAKMRARRFGLLVVDVEMPGMDGFELVRVVRSDPRLAEIPAILVTSRGAPEDRRRGIEVGAHAYIVKSEFDQARLLAHVQELLG